MERVDEFDLRNTILERRIKTEALAETAQQTAKLADVHTIDLIAELKRRGVTLKGN